MLLCGSKHSRATTWRLSVGDKTQQKAVERAAARTSSEEMLKRNCSHQMKTNKASQFPQTLLLRNNIWTANVFSLTLTVAIIQKKNCNKTWQSIASPPNAHVLLRTNKAGGWISWTYPGITDLFLVTIYLPEHYCYNMFATTHVWTTGRQKYPPNTIYKNNTRKKHKKEKDAQEKLALVQFALPGSKLTLGVCQLHHSFHWPHR